MDNEVEIIELPSSRTVRLSRAAYAAYYANFSDDDVFVFDDHVNSGLYFSQITQFLAVFIIILTGNSAWTTILLGSFIPAVVCMIVWYGFRLYRLPGLCFVFSLIGNNLFRFYIHYLPLWILAIFLLKSWRIFLFCILGDLIARVVSAILYALFATVKYNDALAKYIAGS